MRKKKNVGGHIDLSTSGREVFIEIDPDAKAFPDSVGATLCHEICHKWLQVKGISSLIEMDNEILTDITAVFLGFGKIMLNGCGVKKVTREGTITTTETRTCGYLKRDQLAFAYRLVCAMRKVPFSEYGSGLNREAADSIRACDRSFGQHYSDRFHHVGTITGATKSFQLKNVSHQQQLAELNKHLEYIKQSLCETVDAFLVTAHGTVRKLCQRAETIAGATDYNPTLRFLRSIRNNHELEQLTEEVAAVGRRTQKLLSYLKEMARQLWRSNSHFPRPSATMFNIVKCPQDGTKLRLPEDSPDLIVSCPTCRCRFAYNTKCITFSVESSQLRQQNLGWREQIWKFLRGSMLISPSK